MKTLILNGSPTKNGDTIVLINEFVSHLSGDIKILSHYDNIPPCVDCRYCWNNHGCCTDDEKIKEFYKYLDDCDNIVLASPIWFTSLSGPLLNLASRVQALWANNYFLQKPCVSKIKNGVIILVGAQAETVDIPDKTALGIMRYMNVHRPGVARIYSLDTNNLPAAKDEVSLKKCREVAEMLNCICQ